MTALTTVTDGRVDALIQVVLDGLTSDKSRRAYGVALREFMGWYTGTG